jgi:hypothetical protein
MKVNETKSVQVTFTLKKNTWPPFQLNNKLAQPEGVKYLGIHLDLKVRKLYWIIGRKSQLSLENKLLVYKAILKRIWTYGVKLWGSASNSTIKILEIFQSKVLRIITDAPRYVPNAVIKRDIKVLSVRQEVRTTVSPTVKGLTITPTDWKNLYFKEQITTVGYSGITMQI